MCVYVCVCVWGVRIARSLSLSVQVVYVVGVEKKRLPEPQGADPVLVALFRCVCVSHPCIGRRSSHPAAPLVNTLARSPPSRDVS